MDVFPPESMSGVPLHASILTSELGEPADDAPVRCPGD
jgi:hypothetical protein